MDSPTANGRADKYVEPTTTTFGKSKKCQWLWGLWFYTGAVTAALIVLAIVGSIHLKEVKKECDCKEITSPGNVTEAGKWQKLDIENLPAAKRLFSLPTTRPLAVSINVRANKEMIKGDNGTLVLVEFNKHRITQYDGNLDICSVNDQLSPNIANVTELAKLLDYHVSDANSTVETIVYEISDLLQDRSDLPAELEWMCEGKDVYTMYKTIAEAKTQQGSVPAVTPKDCRVVCTPGPSYCCRHGLWRCKQYCHETKCITVCY